MCYLQYDHILRETARKLSVNIALVHSIKAYRRSRNIDPIILNLDC
jgi:hypothetical protein